MLDATYHFANFDPCPYPRPSDFDGLAIPWPDRTFINPPFTGDYGSKTAFIRKAIAENVSGKTMFGIISSTGGHVINLLLGAGALSFARSDLMGELLGLASRPASRCGARCRRCSSRCGESHGIACRVVRQSVIAR